MTEAETRYVELLVDGLPRWLGRHPGPVWAVHINRVYGDPFWPMVRVETLAQREERMPSLLVRPTDAFPVAGSTPEPDIEPPEEDEVALGAVIEQLGDDWDSARRVTAAAARRLNDAPEKFEFARSDDFVVYCCAFDADDIAADLVACLPEHRVKLFRSRGWL